MVPAAGRMGCGRLTPSLELRRSTRGAQEDRNWLAALGLASVANTTPYQEPRASHSPARVTAALRLTGAAGPAFLRAPKSPAHRKRTSSFAANLARAGAKRWCQRSSDPASVPLRSCARAAASDTERGESAEPWQREALQLTCSTRPPSAPNWRGSGRGYLTSWFNSKIGSSIARTMTSTSPPITRIISGPSSPTSACSSESSSRSW